VFSTGTAALLVVSLAAGLAAGGWVKPGRPLATSTATVVPAPPVLPAPTPSAGRAPPPSCQTAVHTADEVISYLVGGIRDRRLETALRRYVVTAATCRKQHP
jgi:hypothetical protein